MEDCTELQHSLCSVIVNWGDTTVDWSKAYFLGQFDMVHQYAKRDRTYDVTVYYCSTPNFVYANQHWLSQGCCGSIFGPNICTHVHTFNKAYNDIMLKQCASFHCTNQLKNTCVLFELEHLNPNVNAFNFNISSV